MSDDDTLPDLSSVGTATQRAGKITLTLDDAWKERLQAAAEDHGISLTDAVLLAVAEHIQTWEDFTATLADDDEPRPGPIGGVSE